MKNIKRSIMISLMFMVCVMAFCITASAGEDFYTYDSICAITARDIGVVRNSRGCKVQKKYGKEWAKFSSGGRDIYIELRTFEKAKNLANDDRASDMLTSGINYSGKSHTYTRVYQKKLRNNYVLTAIANYTVYAKNAGNYILVKCTLNDAVTVTYGSKSNFSAWPGIECQTAITTIDVQATKGKTYTFNVGKTKYKVHGGSFQDYRTEGRGYLVPKYSVKDYVRIAYMTAKTVKKFVSDIANKNLVSILETTHNLLNGMVKKSGSYRTDGSQQLSDGMKYVYRLQLKQPIQLINPGDYFETIIDTDPKGKATAWKATIKQDVAL